MKLNTIKPMLIFSKYCFFKKDYNLLYINFSKILEKTDNTDIGL
jgi:hypothetical protein